MRRVKWALAFWYLAVIDLWLFCWSYGKGNWLYFVGATASLVAIAYIPRRLVQRLAKRNGKAAYEHLFGFWQNAKWCRRKEELLAGPPEMRQDLELMETLRQWLALGPWFAGSAVFAGLGGVLLMFGSA